MTRLAVVLSSMALCASAAAQQADPQQTPAPSPSPSYGLLIRGQEAEEFLRSGKVIKKKAIGTGVTNPYQVTLTDGTRTLKAAWKTIDKSTFGVTQFDRGGFEVNFRDTYKFGIAAYELDKILQLDLVPPTIERTLDGQKGSLALWVESATTEWDRRKKKMQPPDVEGWNQQIYKVRLLHQLIYDTDYANIRNVLCDPSFKVYAIDFTRAFRIHDKLLSEKDLARFSRSALEHLRTLDRPLLDQKLGAWLMVHEIEGLLKRRDKILALADRLVKEQGDSVLYP